MTNQEVLKQQLHVLGFYADFAIDGVDAFDLWNSEDYHLLLTDIHMPNMDGFELVNSIRNTKKYRDNNIVIIAITADAMEGQAQRCLDAGMDDYIAKPVHMKELKHKLNQHLQIQLNEPSVDSNFIQEQVSNSEEVQPDNSDTDSHYNIHILVVEDDEFVQELIQHQLNLLGYYNIDVADNGIEALELLQRVDYQLLWTDIIMPLMGGFELVSHIRNSKKFINTQMKIIAFTGDFVEGDEDRYINAGMDDVTEKPVSQDDLKEILKKWFPMKLTNDIIVSDFANEDVNSLSKGVSAEPPIVMSELIKIVGNDPAIIKDLLYKFVHTSYDDVEGIQHAYANKDHNGIDLQSHKLKGGALSVGATHLGETCKALQLAAKDQRWDDIKILVAKVSTLYQSVKDHIEKNI